MLNNNAFFSTLSIPYCDYIVNAIEYYAERFNLTSVMDKGGFQQRLDTEFQGRLLRLMSVSDQPRYQVDHEAGHTAVPGVFNLRDVLELVID